MKVYYGNMINLSGLYSKEPVECILNDKLDAWDSEGDFYINPEKLGTEIRNGYIKFSSENKLEVEIWTKGVLASMKMLNRWCK